MMDLFDLVRRAPATDALPARPAPRLVARAAGYDGPERRTAAALQHRRLAQLFDAIDYGMVLMDHGDRVALTNKAARRALDDHHPLLLDGDLLQARRPTDAALLREALAGAAQRGLRRLLQLGDKGARAAVAVVPLGAIGREQATGVALLLARRTVCEELTVDWFARAHGLTLAETAVVRGLCADLTPQQIAERHGVGLATIRTQIGSIRTKTGAGSIRALVRQVALLPPLVTALQAPSLAGVPPLSAIAPRGAADPTPDGVTATASALQA